MYSPFARNFSRLRTRARMRHQPPSSSPYRRLDAVRDNPPQQQGARAAQSEGKQATQLAMRVFVCASRFSVSHRVKNSFVNTKTHEFTYLGVAIVRGLIARLTAVMAPPRSTVATMHDSQDSKEKRTRKEGSPRSSFVCSRQDWRGRNCAASCASCLGQLAAQRTV